MTTTTPEMFTEHRFRQAFVDVQPRLAAMPAESLLTINLDIPSAVVMVLGSAPEIRALRSQVVEQLPRFDVALFDGIETFALAAGQAHPLHLAASAPPQPVQELSDQLTALWSSPGFVDRGLRCRGESEVGQTGARRKAHSAER